MIMERPTSTAASRLCVCVCRFTLVLALIIAFSLVLYNVWQILLGNYLSASWNANDAWKSIEFNWKWKVFVLRSSMPPNGKWIFYVQMRIESETYLANKYGFGWGLLLLRYLRMLHASWLLFVRCQRIVNARCCCRCWWTWTCQKCLIFSADLLTQNLVEVPKSG